MTLKNQKTYSECNLNLQNHLLLNGNCGCKQMFDRPGSIPIMQVYLMFYITLPWWIFFSKCVEMHECEKQTSAVTISFSHQLLTKYGIPDTIVWDKGTQFMPNEFRKVCQMFVTKHTTSLLYHPRLNGQVE